MKALSYTKSGFTLIELIVTVTIIIVLFGSALAGYYRFSLRQASLNDARNFATELRKVQSMAKNLVYPGACVGLVNYHLSPACSGTECRSVKIAATCQSGGDANGEIVVTESEEVLQKAYFSDQVGTFTFGAGTGVISPVGSFDLTYSNSPYVFSVDLDSNGNITVKEK